MTADVTLQAGIPQAVIEVIADDDGRLKIAPGQNIQRSEMSGLQIFIPPSKSLTDYANVVVVDSAGNGDYETQAAAAAAITDDDASHVYNVFVFGESVSLATWANRPYIKVHGHECNKYVAIVSQDGEAAPTAARPSEHSQAA